MTDESEDVSDLAVVTVYAIIVNRSTYDNHILNLQRGRNSIL